VLVLGYTNEKVVVGTATAFVGGRKLSPAGISMWETPSCITQAVEAVVDVAPVDVAIDANSYGKANLTSR
jgi:hypothetical protein